MYFILIISEEKPYKCNFCEKIFSWNAKLIENKCTHSEEKPFKCKFCEKRFSWNWNLNEHECRHSEEKPFKCKFCEKRFFLNGNWIKHKRTGTEEKPFKCIECTYIHLTKHQQGYNERIFSNVNFVKKGFLKVEAYPYWREAH